MSPLYHLHIFFALVFFLNIVGLPLEATGKDGAQMVLVPAGAFTMGSPEGKGERDEHPQHTVDLHAFYIDKYEITVEQ